MTLLTALLLTLLTVYFRFDGWRYILFVFANQNHCYMPKLNDIEIMKTLFTLSIALKSPRGQSVLYFYNLLQTFTEASYSNLQGDEDYIVNRILSRSLSPMISSRFSFSPWSLVRFEMAEQRLLLGCHWIVLIV